MNIQQYIKPQLRLKKICDKNEFAPNIDGPEAANLRKLIHYSILISISPDNWRGEKKLLNQGQAMSVDIGLAIGC